MAAGLPSRSTAPAGTKLPAPHVTGAVEPPSWTVIGPPDAENPPPFVAILPLRADAANPPEYGGEEVAAQQRAAYPAIQALSMPLPPDQSFEQALATAVDQGWEIVAAFSWLNCSIAAG